MANNYYTLTNFRNTFYALDIALENHFANLLFNGDATKIIYSSTANAFRERSSSQSWNNLYLPFMNYKKIDITNPSEDRPWWNNTLNYGGIWNESLQRKIRYTPVHVNYEASFFCHRDDDLNYAMSELIWDDSHETLLSPQISLTQDNVDYTLDLVAVLGYNLSFDPEYDQKDFFEINNIHSITLDFEFDYCIIRDNTTGFGIPEEVLLNFGRIKDLNSNIDEIYKFLIDRTHENVTWDSTTKDYTWD